jgi:REP element-mobilizing transposase RayT
MPRPLRSDVFRPEEIAILHCTQRCVRRAYLSGIDSVSGKDYSYRKEWIRQRIEKLASVFGIDVLTYAILSNHLHVVLRNRPDVVAAWSDRQVALRWLQIFPGKRIDEQLGDPTTTDVEALANNPERMAVVRLRLSDVSWFMRALSEPIARLANQQEKCTGCFWEGRFKAQRLLDEAALLACCMYVDLNPVRAAMAESPEESQFTSAYDRIKALQGHTVESAAAPMQTITREEAAKILKSSTPEELRSVARRLRNDGGHELLEMHGWHRWS